LRRGVRLPVVPLPSGVLVCLCLCVFVYVRACVLRVCVARVCCVRVCVACVCCVRVGQSVCMQANRECV